MYSGLYGTVFVKKIPGVCTGDFSRHIMVYKFHMDYSPVQ